MPKIAWKTSYLILIPNTPNPRLDWDQDYTAWKGDCPAWFAEGKRHPAPGTIFKVVRTAKVAPRDHCSGCSLGFHTKR